MSRYRRSHTAGATYFFTVVSYRRQAVLCETRIREALRDAIVSVRGKRPFAIDAWVLLPDHLHYVWTMPPGDADYATRWGMIKRYVSIQCGESYKKPEWITASKHKYRESTIWQRRYWEHQIRDERDFERHVDYVHYNPVKHKRCHQAVDWPYSTFLVMWREVFIQLIGGVSNPGRESNHAENDLPAWAQKTCPPYLTYVLDNPASVSDECGRVKWCVLGGV